MSAKLQRHSQNARILRELVRANGNWVGMPRLSRVSRSLNIHSRVDELRHRYGYCIENFQDPSVRPHVSKYRLVARKQKR